ncbi:MAG: hypothetical protein R2708_04745 [Vicinamibacterales bacterium]
MFWYYRRLDDRLTVMHARRNTPNSSKALQVTCFPPSPTRSASKARHYRKHQELFDEGQFISWCSTATAW